MTDENDASPPGARRKGAAAIENDRGQVPQAPQGAPTAAPPKAPAKDRGVRRAALALLIRVIVLAAVLTVVFTYGFLVCRVQGQGMFPALKDGDVCLVFRTPAMRLTGQTLIKDDVIVYRIDGKRYFGRVVAAAGDEVKMDGRLSVNGAAADGEILYPTYTDGDTTLTVPENTVYALGDYRTGTTDSRTLGPVPQDAVEGRVITLFRRRGL